MRGVRLTKQMHLNPQHWPILAKCMQKMYAELLHIVQCNKIAREQAMQDLFASFSVA